MFELPETLTLARQARDTLTGKVVQQGIQGNSPHKFVWYNHSPEEFRELTLNKRVGPAYARGRWLFIPLEPGYVLVFGECGGKILYHPDQTSLPKKYHLYLAFQDGSYLTATTQMWGAMELYEQGQEGNRQYIKDMRPTPVEPAFTFEYFSDLLTQPAVAEKRSAKGLLTQEQIIPGLGNSIAQDILFTARLHPKHPVADLDASQCRLLYGTIIQTVAEVTEKGGRSDEVDLYNQPGGYHRLMDSNAAGQPCPECGHTIEKIQYLGGACYFCPVCQK